MSYYSNVKLLIADKGYEMLKEKCLKSTEQYVKDMILKVNSLQTSEDYSLIPKNSKLLTWKSCKWRESFKDVGAVISTLKELDSIVEEDHKKLEHYFYKLIEIEESNETNIMTNDEDEVYTEDFYVECDFSI